MFPTHIGWLVGGWLIVKYSVLLFVVQGVTDDAMTSGPLFFGFRMPTTEWVATGASATVTHRMMWMAVTNGVLLEF